MWPSGRGDRGHNRHVRHDGHRAIAVGQWPTALAVVAGQLYVCNQDRHTVSVVDVSQTPPRANHEVPVTREPVSIAATPDHRHVVVANLLAHGVATDPRLAAEISIIDASGAQGEFVGSPASGSTVVNGVCTSPDGRWAYAVHQLSRFSLPVTQLSAAGSIRTH